MSSARRGSAGRSGKRASHGGKAGSRASKGSTPAGAGKNASAAGKSSGTRGAAGKAGSGTRGKAGAGSKGKAGAGTKGKAAAGVVFDAPPAPRVEPVRLGFVAGATPGKWVSIWRDRYPDTELELVPLDASTTRAQLLNGDIDLAIAREPFSHDDLHVIALYEEIVGVVVSVDSVLESAHEVTVDDLAGEVVIVPQDDAVHFGEIPGTIAPRFAAPATTEAAIETVATGVGVVLVPMSIARAHRRKDVTFRPLVDAAPTRVALAWDRSNEAPEIQAFIGIVRGRTAQSSRD